MAATRRIELAPARLLAPAKLNLALHVTGWRPDGYHDIDSLVAFASDGDRLQIAPAGHDSFTLTGPFAPVLEGSAGNLVLHALDFARELAASKRWEIGPLALRLDKRLPVASGIGGGSADAAALLRAATGALPQLRDEIARAALRLGADLPMCLLSRPLRAKGLGEVLEPLSRFPAIPILLVNPGPSVPTPEVFRRLAERSNPPLPALPDGGFPDLRSLLAYLRTTRNDLEAPAIAFAPVLEEVRQAVAGSGAAFARMSGSGATVFGLFDTPAAAERAAAMIRKHRPDWWVLACEAQAATRNQDA